MFVSSTVAYRLSSMIIPLKVRVFRVKYRVFIVRHIIYDYHCLCVSSRVSYLVLLFDISSMTFLLYGCLPKFNSVLIVRHFICEHRCFCLCHPEINTVPLTLDILSIIIVIICSCPPEINTVSVMFDISSMLTVVYDCFFHSYIPYHIVRHIIHDHPSLCLCFPELNIVSSLFDT